MSKKFPITEWFWIDEDLKIKAIKTPQSDSWYARFNLPGVGQKKQSLKTKSKKQAIQNGARFANEFRLGNVTAKKRSRTTIREAADRQCDWLASKGRKPSTVEGRRRTYKKLDVWTRSKGIQYLDQMNIRAMEDFESRLREEGVALPVVQDAKGRKHVPGPLAPSYLRGTMKLIRGLIHYAVDHELIDRDPCPTYELPPEPDEEVEVFAPAELLLIFADEAPFADLWRFLLHTCLRRLELCWLMREDVVFDRAGEPTAIRIRKKTCPLTQKKWRPKHGLERVVPLTATAIAIVKKWLTSGSGPWLFGNPAGSQLNGGRWNGDDLLKRLQKRLKDVGIDHGVLHVFRHTGASLLANDPNHPMPLPHLQKFLGHRSIVTTQRYLHSNADDIAAALRRIDLDRAATVTEEASSAGAEAGGEQPVRKAS